LTAFAVFAACAETRRSLGEGCLKSEDCLSGVCAGAQCVAAPPLLDAEPPFPDAAPAPPAEAGTDGPAADASVAPEAPEASADGAGHADAKQADGGG
jgi:hypothetical protein